MDDVRVLKSLHIENSFYEAVWSVVKANNKKMKDKITDVIHKAMVPDHKIGDADIDEIGNTFGYAIVVVQHDKKQIISIGCHNGAATKAVLLARDQNNMFSVVCRAPNKTLFPTERLRKIVHGAVDI